MKASKCIVVFILFITSLCSLKAQEVSPSQAISIAEQVLKIVPEQISSIQLSADSVFYIIQSQASGWVLVSATKNIDPLIAYSQSGIYSGCSNSFALDALISQKLPEKMKTARTAWQRADKGQLRVPLYRGSVKPLLTENWNQNSPYNDKCPVIDGTKAPTGCTATALSQIMNYHKHPLKGVGKYSYTPYSNPQLGELTVDFSQQTYNWANKTNADYAMISYQVGVSVNMDYKVGGSGAWLGGAVSALPRYFGYSSDIRYLVRSNYELDEWIGIIKNELDNGRPIAYSGNNPIETSVGHAFVIDGYDEFGFFHINMGWGGTSNGFYNINSILTHNGKSNFSGVSDDMLIGIEPAKGSVGSPEISPFDLSVSPNLRLKTYIYDTPQSVRMADVFSIEEGQQYFVDLPIKNSGISDITDSFSVVLYIDNKLVNTSNYNFKISSGSTTYGALNFDNLSVGTHKLTVNVDEYNSIAERNEQNNTASMTIEVKEAQPEPNLKPHYSSPITFSKITADLYGQLYDTSNVCFQYRIMNESFTPIPDEFTVNVLVDGTLLAAPTITSIRAHDAFKSQTICAGVLNAGKHDISIEIDANNTIAESSDLDNNYTAQVTILPTGVDLVADKYQENWESPIALFDMNGDMLLGTNLTEGILSIQAGIKNQGSALQNPGWKASLYIDDKIVTTKSLPIIGSGQKVIISTDQVLKNGEHTAKLVIDYGNSIAEKDETNNEYSLTFTVNDPDLVFVLPKPTGPTLIKDYSQPARYSSVESKGVVSYYWFFSDESLYDSIVYSANKMYVDVYWKEYNGKNTSLLVYPIFKNKNYGLQSPYIVISLDGGVDYAAPSGDTVINDLEKYYTYTATAVDGATSYQWNVSGFTDTIISSDGSQISVLWDITHNVSTINLSSKAVFADSIQPSFSDVLSVKINAISDVILGDSLINDFQRNFTYTAPNNPDAVSYEWSVYPKYVKSSSSSLFGGLQYMIGWNIISMGAIAHLQARPVYKDGTKGEYCEPFKVTLANSKGEFIAANPAPPKGEAVICDRSAHFRYVAQEVPNAVSYWVCDDVKKNYYATYTEKGASKNEFMFTSINDTVIDTVRIYITTLDDQGKLQSISDVLEIVLGGNPSAEPIETVGDLLFCENITVELSAKASAGSTILWSSGQSDAKISVNAGTFSYTATEAGCVAYSDTITIVMPTRNEITAQVVPVTICPGQTANVTTTDNVKWETGTVSAKASFDQPGTYSYSYSDIQCGTITRKFTIDASPTDTIHISSESSLLCDGDAITLTANKVVEWSSGKSGKSITINNAGTYSAQGTSLNGCPSVPDTIIVKAYQFPDLTATVDKSEICPGQKATVNVGVAVKWPNGLTNNSAVFTEPGIYTYTYTHEKCGSVTESVTIGQRKADNIVIEAKSTNLCDTDEITISASQSVKWSNGNTGRSITISEAGHYSASGVDQDGCPFGSNSIAITGGKAPEIIINLDVDAICKGESAVATANVPVKWFDNSESTSVTVSKPGTFTYTFNSVCDAQSGTFTVGEKNTPSLNITSDKKVLCATESITLTTDQSVVWSTGHIGQSITVDAPGVYTASSQGQSCAGSAEVEITSSPIKEIVSIEIIDGKLSLDIEGDYTSEWYFGSNKITPESFTVQPGRYSVKVSDAYGCKSIAFKTYTDQMLTISGIDNTRALVLDKDAYYEIITQLPVIDYRVVDLSGIESLHHQTNQNRITVDKSRTHIVQLIYVNGTIENIILTH